MIGELNIISIVLLSVLGICFLIQVIYYLIFLNKPSRYLKKSEGFNLNEPANQPPVSIVICSKNESQNLERFLPSILEQDYPRYEVIVVNDGSTDESDEILGALEKQYKHLYRTYIPEESRYLSRKKLAMTVGIKAAKYDLLLFTEACCEPVSKHWISTMCRHFSDGKTVVLGFSPLAKKSGFLGKFAAFDNLTDGLQYLSLALFKHPYRGVGRNMAYAKSHFFSNKGFSKYMHLQAGEDDLFINQISDSENTAVEILPDSLTQTHLGSFGVWEEMRLSHSTTQRYYRSGPVMIWLIESISRVLLWASVVAIIIYELPNYLFPIISGLLLVIKLVIQLIVINKTCKRLRVEKFYYILPIFDLFQPFFDLYIYLRRLIRGKKDYTWR